MDEDYIKEPEHGRLKYSPEEINTIRKASNLDNKNDREKAIAIIDEWVKNQEHFVKKDYSKGYIERCLITCNGSLERTKKQIDKICTFRNLMAHFFDISSFSDPKLQSFFNEKGYACAASKLTKECHRVIVIKGKHNIGMNSADIRNLFKAIIFGAEYLKSHDFQLGIQVIFDMFDTNVSNIFPHANLLELQQFISIFTQGYGCKIKGIYLITNSKLLETFIKILKPILSEKIASRIHALSDRKLLKNFIDVDCLPEDYGGPELSVAQLHEIMCEILCTNYVDDFMKEMKKGVVDETKRRIDLFNDEYMGVSGSFRTLSLD